MATSKRPARTLLTLPAKIRLKIYSHLSNLTSVSIIRDPLDPRDVGFSEPVQQRAWLMHAEGLNLNLLLTCKFIYEEAKPVLESIITVTCPYSAFLVFCRTPEAALTTAQAKIVKVLREAKQIILHRNDVDPYRPGAKTLVAKRDDKKAVLELHGGPPLMWDNDYLWDPSAWDDHARIDNYDPSKSHLLADKAMFSLGSRLGRLRMLPYEIFRAHSSEVRRLRVGLDQLFPSLTVILPVLLDLSVECWGDVAFKMSFDYDLRLHTIENRRVVDVETGKTLEGYDEVKKAFNAALEAYKRDFDWDSYSLSGFLRLAFVQLSLSGFGIWE